MNDRPENMNIHDSDNDMLHLHIADEGNNGGIPAVYARTATLGAFLTASQIPALIDRLYEYYEYLTGDDIRVDEDAGDLEGQSAYLRDRTAFAEVGVLRDRVYSLEERVDDMEDAPTANHIAATAGFAEQVIEARRTKERLGALEARVDDYGVRLGSLEDRMSAPTARNAAAGTTYHVRLRDQIDAAHRTRG